MSVVELGDTFAGNFSGIGIEGLLGPGVMADWLVWDIDGCILPFLEGLGARRGLVATQAMEIECIGVFGHMNI